MMKAREGQEHVVKRSKFSEDQIAFALKQADLGKRGGKMKLHTCDGRLCVQIDDSAQSYSVQKTGESLRVIKGY